VSDTTPRGIWILGGGIAGLSVCDALVEASDRVTCVRQSAPAGTPATDTQRNHGWLQSGFLYPEDVDLAMRMRSSGLDLLRRYRMSLDPRSFGIFGFNPESEHLIQEFHRLAVGALGHAGVDELPRIAASRRLGEFFVDGMRYFRVPDAPFDEGELLTRAYEEAKAAGVEFVEAADEVRARVRGSAAVFELAGDLIEPDVLVLCAGRGTPALLRDLGVSERLRTGVFRSVLLRVRDRPLPTADLLVDRDSGLSVVQHRDVCVIGGRGRVELGAEPEHAVTADERDHVWALIPEAAQKRMLQFEHRWTAGIKTEGLNENGLPSVRPVVAGPEVHGVTNLIVALPGKATLAAEMARLVAEKVAELRRARVDLVDRDARLDLRANDAASDVIELRRTRYDRLVRRSNRPAIDPRTSTPCTTTLSTRT